jgi:alpha-tubulin suppressor-like RCC1 family protein
VDFQSRLYCWGSNQNGQQGDGTVETHRSLPTLVPIGSIAGVAPGSEHTCAITTEDRVWCWGYNGVGAVGDGTTTTPRPSPVAVVGDLRIETMNAGYLHNCAVTPTGRGYCWGEGTLGQLGNNGVVGSSVPVRVAAAP